jgi:hypothetical protein
VIDLKTQLSFFKDLARLLRRELGCKKANTLLGRAVYLLHIGANDYGVFSTTNSSVLSPEEYVNMVIGNVTTVIEVIKLSTIQQNYYIILSFFFFFHFNLG